MTKARSRLIIAVSALAALGGLAYFVLNELSATLVLRWLVAKTGAPVAIRSASWKFSWSDFFKHHRVRGLHVLGDLTTANRAFEISASLNYEKPIVKIFPQVRIEGIPPFSGNVTIDVKSPEHRVDFDIVGLEAIGPAKNWKAKGFAEIKETWAVEAGVKLSEIELKSEEFPLKLAEVPAQIRLSLGKPSIPLEVAASEPIDARFSGEYKEKEKSISGQLEANADLHRLVNEILVGTLTEADKIGNVPILNRASAKGKLGFKGLLEWSTNGGLKVQGTAALAADALEFPARDFYLDGVHAKIPVNYPNPAPFGTISVRALEFRRMKMKPFALDARIDQIAVELRAQGKGSQTAIEQNIWGNTVRLAQFRFLYPWGGNPDFNLALKGGPFRLQDIQRDLCINPSHPLQGQLSFDYPKIQQNKSRLTIKGGAQMEIFSGKVRAGDIDVFLGDADPVLYVDVFWDDLDMAAIGEWTKFGDMRGSIHGSLRDAKIILSNEGAIPVAYDLTIRGSERGGNKIRFYGRAVNNVLELLSVKKDEMPFFAKWVIDLTILVRNWMPVVVDYLGFRATSDGEWTKISTFDPEKSGNHYILYGTSFKIPLQTSGVYPVVMKADAFQGWLTGMKNYFGSLSKKGEETNECPQ